MKPTPTNQQIAKAINDAIRRNPSQHIHIQPKDSHGTIRIYRAKTEKGALKVCSLTTGRWHTITPNQLRGMLSDGLNMPKEDTQC